MSCPRFWTLSSNTLYLHGTFYLSKEIHRCILLHISRGSLSCMFFVISKCILCWLLTVSTQHHPCPLNSSCIHRSRKPKDYISQILLRQGSSFDSTNESHSREIWKVEEKRKPWSFPRHRPASQLLQVLEGGSAAASIRPPMNRLHQGSRQLRSQVTGLLVILITDLKLWFYRVLSKK